MPAWGQAHPALSFSDYIAITRGGAAAARQAHNLEVVGSNPTPAKIQTKVEAGQVLPAIWLVETIGKRPVNDLPS
jgi:hypothetical protein